MTGRRFSAASSGSSPPNFGFYSSATDGDHAQWKEICEKHCHRFSHLVVCNAATVGFGSIVQLLAAFDGTVIFPGCAPEFAQTAEAERVHREYLQANGVGHPGRIKAVYGANALDFVTAIMNKLSEDGGPPPVTAMLEPPPPSTEDRSQNPRPASQEARTA